MKSTTPWLLAFLVILAVLAPPSLGAPQVTQILDATGDGVQPLTLPVGLVVDDEGNVYVAGIGSDNVLRVSGDGAVSVVVDAAGDGAGNPLVGPFDLALDEDGNLFVTGAFSNNVFMVTDPGGASTIVEVLDESGDGAGNELLEPRGVAVGPGGTLYVTGVGSDNAFQVVDPGGANVVTKIIDQTGNGSDDPLNNPVGIVVDREGDVYLTGADSQNAFRITDPGGANVVTEIIGPGNSGVEGFQFPNAIAVDRTGNVFVSAYGTSNVHRITPEGEFSVVIDAFGDGQGNELDKPAEGLVVDALGNLYVSGFESGNVFRVTPEGQVTELISSAGDGGEGTLSLARDLAVDAIGNVYVAGWTSNNVLRRCVSLSSQELVRLGSPPNPAALLPGQTSAPVLSAVWDPVIDHSVFQPDAILDVLVIGTDAVNQPSPFGTVLCQPPRLVLAGPPSVPFAVQMPGNCSLLSGQFSAQGVSWDGAAGVALTNALDVTVGTAGL